MFPMKCKIHLPDQTYKEFSKNPSALDVARELGPRLAKDAVGVLVNGSSEVRDIREILNDGDRIEIITLKNSSKSLEVIRHSAAHVLAQATQRLWPDVKVTIGPVIENGFYYDFDTERKFAPEDLEAIEKEMNCILKEKLPVTKEIWPQEKAIDFFRHQGETLKCEMIRDLQLGGGEYLSPGGLAGSLSRTSCSEFGANRSDKNSLSLWGLLEGGMRKLSSCKEFMAPPFTRKRICLIF